MANYGKRENSPQWKPSRASAETDVSKASNRNAMPRVAALVDEWRAVFPGLKVIYAAEGSAVIDRREPVNPESIFDVPQGYAPMREVAKKEKR